MVNNDNHQDKNYNDSNKDDGFYIINMKTYKNETIVVKEDYSEENNKKYLEYDMILQGLSNMVVFFC